MAITQTAVSDCGLSDTDMNRALDRLREKYSVVRRGNIVSGTALETTEGRFALLPWRVERRFAELRNIVSNGTLEEVSTLRFASVAAAGVPLESLLFREFDLAAWITGKRVESVFAACAPGFCAVNVIAGLSGGVKVSIECSNKLPAGVDGIDRHEIIASRGVASDRCVDTQIPQSSLYWYGKSGETRHTDTDAELFGFSAVEAGVVRAAFALLSEAVPGAEWNAAADATGECVRAVFKSDRECSIVDPGKASEK